MKLLFLSLFLITESYAGSIVDGTNPNNPQGVWALIQNGTVVSEIVSSRSFISTYCGVDYQYCVEVDGIQPKQPGVGDLYDGVEFAYAN